jgi:VIT1/CCC1 family predicted Fe2+/Mn2+ transporter
MSVKNWFEEKQSAWLYRVVTQAETDPRKSTLFAELADAAESQARIWEKELEKDPGRVPLFHPSLRARLVAQLIRVLGPRAVRPILIAMKVRGMSVYQGMPIHGGHPMPTTVSEVGGRHKSVEAGGNVRAAVFGVNDGLVSNASLIMGVAGATADLHVVYLSGIAGLLAGSFSMAAGEYVSMRSQRELFEYQISLEREELEEYPLEEQEELALIYNARGLSKEQADDVAAELMKDKEQALDTLAREELGLNPADLGSPWGAAWSSFLSFGAGGAVPLLPFLFGGGRHVMAAAVIITAIALFLVGSALSLFTGKNAWWSGLRMVLIGGGAGLVTFVVGRLLGGGVL